MNLLTNSMNRLTKMLINTDQKLKGMGVEPYGQVKLTDKEQRERIKNMAPSEMFALIEKYGDEAVNKWLSKYWQEGNYGNNGSR